MGISRVRRLSHTRPDGPVRPCVHVRGCVCACVCMLCRVGVVRRPSAQETGTARRPTLHPGKPRSERDPQGQGEQKKLPHPVQLLEGRSDNVCPKPGKAANYRHQLVRLCPAPLFAPSLSCILPSQGHSTASSASAGLHVVNRPQTQAPASFASAGLCVHTLQGLSAPAAPVQPVYVSKRGSRFAFQLLPQRRQHQRHQPVDVSLMAAEAQAS